MNTDGSCDTRNSTTSSTAPSELRSAAPLAVSPFGPVRKREPKPPVKIPGQRKPSDTIGPRPAFPAHTTRTIPLSHDLAFNQGAYDEAYTAFRRSDRIGQPAAWGAFGDDADNKPAIPKIPNPRKPTEQTGAQS
jgi:hypothetical protein